MFGMSEWKTNSQELKFVEPTEPSVLIAEPNGPKILTIKTSGITYNRDEFPQDTAKQAAQRVYDVIKPKHDHVGAQLDLNLTLSAFKEHPQRKFRVNKDGVQHDYNVDTWHWWMLEYLGKLAQHSS